MKHLGIIKESKDITNKEYVDNKDADLDKRKLEDSDLSELPNSRVLELWNQYIGGGSEEGGGGSTPSSSVTLSTDIESDKSSNTKAATPKAVYDYVQKVSLKGTSGITSSTITAIEVYTQEEYESLTELSPTTLYLIKG